MLGAKSAMQPYFAFRWGYMGSKSFWIICISGLLTKSEIYPLEPPIFCIGSWKTGIHHQ
jgi:hypothetical protein